MFSLFYKLDVDECKEEMEEILCPDNSKCINLEPQEDPRGFRCECHNGKPPVNRECDSKSKIILLKRFTQTVLLGHVVVVYVLRRIRNIFT